MPLDLEGVGLHPSYTKRELAGCDDYIICEGELNIVLITQIH